ncbi:MAG: hypothetical protein LCI00_03465 [Chloroflexi bacterium]|nr:hypothetical protein [Chloroflexota bacterium]MCC6891316.1 hypothetical protein [Anaerolineae bacterium]
MMEVVNIVVGSLFMQETRQFILEILRQKSQATVDEIVTELKTRRGSVITAVTVRHHLGELLREELISLSNLRHRNSPGRPQQVYVLTEAAKDYFPNNYQPLVNHILNQLSNTVPLSQVNVLLDGVATCMAADAGIPDLPLLERLNCVVNYLNDHGYNAHWEKAEDGYFLYTANCPYHKAAEENLMLCDMDMKLVAALLGVVPRLKTRISNGDPACSYFIPEQEIVHG